MKTDCAHFSSLVLTRVQWDAVAQVRPGSCSPAAARAKARSARAGGFMNGSLGQAEPLSPPGVRRTLRTQPGPAVAAPPEDECDERAGRITLRGKKDMCTGTQDVRSRRLKVRDIDTEVPEDAEFAAWWLARTPADGGREPCDCRTELRVV